VVCITHSWLLLLYASATTVFQFQEVSLLAAAGFVHRELLANFFPHVTRADERSSRQPEDVYFKTLLSPIIFLCLCMSVMLRLVLEWNIFIFASSSSSLDRE